MLENKNVSILDHSHNPTLTPKSHCFVFFLFFKHFAGSIGNAIKHYKVTSVTGETAEIACPNQKLIVFC